MLYFIIGGTYIGIWLMKDVYQSSVAVSFKTRQLWLYLILYPVIDSVVGYLKLIKLVYIIFIVTEWAFFLQSNKRD